MVAFCIPSCPRSTDKAKSQIAQAAVGRNGDIAYALKRFRIDMARLPTTAEGLDALFAAPGGTEDRWQGPYLEGSPEELRDPWGEKFQYRCPGNVNTTGYDLWSTGPNRKSESTSPNSDDLRNW